MFIYFFILMLSYILASYADRRGSKLAVFFLSLLIVLFTGLRGYTVGIDTETYVEIWDNALYGGLVYQEVGFAGLVALLQCFTSNPTWLLLTTSLLIYPLVLYRLWDFRKIASFPIMVVVFLLVHLMISLNISRQYIAVAIIFFSTRYLVSGKYIKYVIGVLIASLFHLSAIVALAFFGIELLMWNNLSKKKKVFISIGILLLFIILPTIYSFALEEYGSYLDNQSGNMGLVVIFKIIFYCIAFYLLKDTFNGFSSALLKKYGYIVKFCFLSTVIGLLLQSLEYFMPNTGRIGIPFFLFETVMWGIYLKNNKKFRQLYLVVFIILIFIPFILSMIGNGHGTIPYTFFFS